MSYNYGLNGNDLEWSALEGWNMTCCDCDGSEDCDGHTWKYTKKGVPGAIYHDTNGNFVSVTGKIPLYVYHDLYLIDWQNDKTIKDSKRGQIREHLRDRGYIIDTNKRKGLIHIEGGMLSCLR